MDDTLRTAKEVKDKWFNTKKAAKKAYTERKRSINKTGGGPPSKPLSAAVERVLNMCQDSASFKGIDGVETDVIEQEATLPEEDASEDLFQSAMSSPSTPQSPSLFSQDETTTNTAVVLEPEVIIISKPLQEKNTEIQEKKRVATSLSDVKSNRKRKTPADVNELQCMFLKKEMIKQDKEIIKLDLQIKLLQQLLDRTPTSPTYSQLLSAMF